MTYADYSFYSQSYGGGAIPQESFAVYERRAAEQVDLATTNRARLVEGDLLISVKNAVCAVADALYAAEPLKPGAAITSETTASESVNYATPYPDMDKWRTGTDKEIRRAIRTHLLATGLLYAGVVVARC